ncbi:S-adenosyl-L-methionine-dependent methyltransferase [Decorospora gaudefroyi]|uniref:S-adenosyl-L-methionine-dependent methyltransferase n=1 Tax=Decorospora gaudefroyi TaxID=184978 RepID=A0A6A5KM08_9PLEO|nr:S-adenosyl-L-methionine-dependent methyltransferase [Decorospora gaudefroyi]
MEPTNMDSTINGAETSETRFQTDNSMSRKPQPKQQLSKAMEHMRFAVTVDPIPHTSTPTPPPETSSSLPLQPVEPVEPPENDAYGVPASFAPVRAPPSRSHDASNNQKRSDPFAFGSRYLEEGDNIFEFNAWDHVTVDSTYLAFSEEQYSRQRQEPVSDFDRQRYNAQPEKWWNQFYKNNKTNFFKNRKWLAQEFPILDHVGREHGPPATLLEVGAGAGNTAFPILQASRNKRLKIHACDFSKKAVELIRSHELYDPQFIQADVWDVSASPDPSSPNGGLPPGLEEGTVDVVLMIFIFSALSPTQWDQAVRNVWRVLKPGGQVLFRDYGRGDLAQVRFKKGRYMQENFYVRGDGTRVYFFEQAELERIWAAGGHLNNNNNDDDAEVLQSGVADVESVQTEKPAFEVAHIGVDRRLLVNRQRRLKMYRCWLQAVFRKPGQGSEVPTSTLRQESEEQGRDGDGDGDGELGQEERAGPAAEGDGDGVKV